LHLDVLHYAHRRLPLSKDPALQPLAIPSERTTSSTVDRLSSRMKNIFVMVDGRHFSAKISGKMLALPHTCAKNYDSTQIFVLKTIPQNLRRHWDRREFRPTTI
jgi:hypothetical protein